MASVAKFGQRYDINFKTSLATLAGFGLEHGSFFELCIFKIQLLVILFFSK